MALLSPGATRRPEAVARALDHASSWDGTAATRTDRPALTHRAPMRILYFSDVHLEVRERQAPSSWTGVLPLGFGPDLSTFVGRVDLLLKNPESLYKIRSSFMMNRIAVTGSRKTIGSLGRTG